MTRRYLTVTLSCAALVLLALSFGITKQSAMGGTFTTLNVAVGVSPGAGAVNSVTNKIYVVNCGVN